MTKAKIPNAGNFFDRYFFDKDPHRTLVDQIDAGKYIIGRAKAAARETDFMWQIWTLEIIGTQEQITYASDGEPRFRWVDRLLVTDPDLPDDGSPAGIYIADPSVNAGDPAGTTVGYLFPMAKDVGINSYAFQIISDPSNKFVLDENENNKLLLSDTAYGIDNEYDVEIRVVDNLNRYFQGWITVDVVNLRLTNFKIVETADIGSKIADIIAIGDVPPTTFEIVSDPDNKFDIIGTDLITDNTLDFSVKESHEVTIKYIDSNADERQETFTIEVLADPQSLLAAVTAEDLHGKSAIRVLKAEEKIVNDYNEVTNLDDSEITVLTHMCPSGVFQHLLKAQCSGDNRAKYSILVNGQVVWKVRSYYTDYNAPPVDLGEYQLTEGDIVEIKADSMTNSVANFNATLTYKEHEE